MFPFGTTVFPFGTAVVPIWNSCCSHLEQLVFPFGTAGVPIWNSWCSHLEQLVFPFGTAGVPIWNSWCSHLEQLLSPFGTAAVPVWKHWLFLSRHTVFPKKHSKLWRYVPRFETLPKYQTVWLVSTKVKVNSTHRISLWTSQMYMTTSYCLTYLLYSTESLPTAWHTCCIVQSPFLLLDIPAV